MSEYLRNEKKRLVNNYISSIDMSIINTDQISRDLSRLIGEKPAVRLNYSHEPVLNENGKKSKPIEKLESITVVFTVERDVNGLSVNFPVEETYLIE